MSDKNYVCSECGHEQDSMMRPCDKCASIKVITIAVAEQIGGPNWREAFDAKAQHAEDLADYDGPYS